MSQAKLSAGAVAIGLVAILAGAYPVVPYQQSAQVPMAPPELQHRPTNIVLALDSLGAPWINHQAVPWDQLDRQLQAIYSRRPEKILFLKASPQHPVRSVERLLEMTKRRGITLYRIP